MEVAILVKIRGEWEDRYCFVVLEFGILEEGERMEDTIRCKNLSLLNGIEFVIGLL